jgi:hypothetical protein
LVCYLCGEGMAKMGRGAAIVFDTAKLAVI